MVKSVTTVISDESKLNSIFSTKNGNKENNLKANTMLEKMGFKDEELTTKTHDDIFIELMNKEYIFNIGLIINEYINKEHISFHPEHPVIANNNFVIGFIDILVTHGNKKTLSLEIKTKIENNIGAIIRQINVYKLHIKNSIFIIIAPEVTEKQKNILKESGIYLVSMKDIYEVGIRHKKFKDNFVNEYIPKLISKLEKENEVTMNLSYFKISFDNNYATVYDTLSDSLSNTDICIKDYNPYNCMFVFCYKKYFLEIRMKENIERINEEFRLKKEKHETDKKYKQEIENKLKIEKFKQEEELKNRRDDEF